LESGDVTDRVALLDEPATLRGALAPLRRRLLARLAEPASASQLAPEFGVSRQKLNYHLRKLEDAGLVELVAQRQRRGFTERVLRARPDAYVIDPAGLRLLTFTLETEVRLAAPAEVRAFSDALAGALAEVAARFDNPAGRAYRVIGAGHPAIRNSEEENDDRAA
jgi:DNA-binding transcriptional ArsR family regulator